MRRGWEAAERGGREESKLDKYKEGARLLGERWLGTWGSVPVSAEAQGWAASTWAASRCGI